MIVISEPSLTLTPSYFTPVVRTGPHNMTINTASNTPINLLYPYAAAGYIGKIQNDAKNLAMT